MITKEMIEQAKTRLQCVNDPAHAGSKFLHPWIDTQPLYDYPSREESEVEGTYHLFLCKCGATRIFRGFVRSPIELEHIDA